MQVQHHKGVAAILAPQHFGVPPKLGMGKAQGQPPPLLGAFSASMGRFGGGEEKMVKGRV